MAGLTAPPFFMPLNENTARLSTLTPEQRHEQESAIYGLGENMQNGHMTVDEIEKMRMIVAQQDSKARSENIFDINRPVTQKYIHQEYPKTLYNHAQSKPETTEKKIVHGEAHEVHVPAQLKTCIVRSEDERDAKLAEGWELKPPVFDGKKKKA